MRFSIRDLLLMTFVAILVVLAFAGHNKTKQLSLQVNDAREKSKSLKSSASAIESRLAYSKSDQRLAYFRQVQTAAEPAIAGFKTVRERYGKLETQPNKVVMRRVPEYRQTLENAMTHWRISVPSEQPVYLRSGICTEVVSREKNKLDTADWMTNTPFLDSNPYQIQLEPGINDLRILATSSSGSKLELQLGDQQLLSTKFVSDHNGYRSARPSGREPFAISLAKKTQYLFEISFNDDSPRYEYWIWLSSNPNVEGFKPFPVIPIPQKQTTSERSDE